MATSSSSSSSATSLQLQSLLIGRKYPFIFALSALLITVTVLFFTTTDSTTFTSALSFFRPSSLSSQDDTTDSSSKYNRNDVDIDSRNSNDNINTTTTIPPVISDNINTNTVVAPVVSYVPPPFPSQNSTVNSNDGVNSNNNKNINKNDDNGNVIDQKDKSVVNVKFDSINWVLCKGVVAVDYIPCLDNFKAIKQLQSRRHMEHRERHCPDPPSRCLTPLPVGYKLPVPWPKSRDMIWYDNVPHPKLTQYKKDQNWVRKTGDYFHFPGGGTQFKGGVTHYVEFIEKTFPAIEWGKRIRVILDVGCGVASFGGYLLDKNVITMSIAPKDEHEAQIQFALERGIPATLSVIGTQKLTFPDDAYDLIHCARCRVHWDADGGKPLMELNRILRPGGFFVWSATPVYRNDERDSSVWNAMVALTESMCWKTVAKTFDSSARVGFVIYQKPVSYSCYEKRRENKPPLCDHKDRLNSSWYVPIPDCLSRLPEDNMGKLSNWPMSWPQRLGSKPTNLFGGPDAEEAWNKDMQYWSALVKDVYLAGLAINWSSVRNVMDMNAGFGGFAAALIDLPLWVMNVVPIDVPDTLPVIFDRGLIGVYHDWCESLNTYPRTYDLLHSSYILRNILQRCDIIAVSAEIDRIMRPGGYILVQDTIEMINMFSPILRSLEWSINIHQDRFLVGKKGFWRPPAGKRQ